MLKRLTVVLIVFIMCLLGTVELFSQDVIMGSAETIKPGNFKLGLFPIVLMDGNSTLGTAGRFGFALNSKSDVEGKFAFIKSLKYYGVDVEFWLIKNRKFNASISIGGHLTQINGETDSSGIDTTFLVSTRAKNRLELCLGLKIAFDSKSNINYSYNLMHLVPGVEYKINKDLDFVAEFGLALNGDTRNYASAGLAFYFQM